MDTTIVINNISLRTVDLIDKAINAMKKAYTPYSNFNVGAVVVDSSGAMYVGANIENASYGLTCCAEQTAIFNAIIHGAKSIIAICVTGNTPEPISPCGACRQVIREFAHHDIQIILSNTKKDIKILTMQELLPYSFGKDDLFHQHAIY